MQWYGVSASCCIHSPCGLAILPNYIVKDVAAPTEKSPNVTCSFWSSYFFLGPHDLALLSAIYVDYLTMDMAAEVVACE
jgi:hypothetical protein